MTSGVPLAVLIDGAQLVGLVLGGVVAGWYAADFTRSRSHERRDDR
jgi:hypothetical protein